MDELLARQAPHSLEAEQAVLGAILIDSRCVADVIGVLRPEDFYLEQNQTIFETIYSMFNFSQVIDPVTVLDKMKERGVFDAKASVQYIMQLMEITPTAANVMQYAEIVRDKALLRNIGQAANDIGETVYEGVGTATDILEAAEKKIFSLRKNQGADSLEHIGTVLLKVYERLNELAMSDSEIPGRSTGFTDLDKKIGGLGKPASTLIAARPGLAKTSISLHIILRTANKSYFDTIAFFSLEISP